MGLPRINITFRAQAATINRRSGNGIVAAIIVNAAGEGGSPSGLYELRSEADMPVGLTAGNQAHIKRIFAGNVGRPAKVLLYVCPTAEFDAALTKLATVQFDWLVAPSDRSLGNMTVFAEWIINQRANYDATYKAVLPNSASDHEAIVNFTSSGIVADGVTYNAADYCGRIAGMLAGTPLTHSCTYAVLPEVSDITRLTRDEMDAAVDAGQLILVHDGVKVKLGRGVTALTNLADDKCAELKKIKIVEALDLIKSDLRVLIQDNYIGKLPNNYDSKCLLIVAVKSYLTELEAAGILWPGTSAVDLDMDAQRAYLAAQGADISNMTDREIREANTGDKVFLAANIRVMDAIEDIVLPITYTGGE